MKTKEIELEESKINQMNKFKHIVEKYAFGVCSYLAHKIGISTYRVRMYFIYLTFAALGSPILVYLFLAFWLNIKKYIRQKRRTVWDL